MDVFDSNTVKVLLVLINLMWGLILLGVGFAIKTAAASLKDLHDSSHSLAVKLGQVDTKVDIAADRLRTIGERTHDLVQTVAVLKNRAGI